MDRLKLNSARCLNCLYILVSLNRHHFITCTCYRAGLAIINAHKGKTRTTKGTLTKTFMKVVEANNNGIFIDGGLDYQ